jgi:hypothetical protein
VYRISAHKEFGRLLQCGIATAPHGRVEIVHPVILPATNGQ